MAKHANQTGQPLGAIDGALAATRQQALHAINAAIAKATGWDDADLSAAVLWLVERHHWTPAQVRGMADADLLLCLAAFNSASARASASARGR